jgi:hypothetical protein
MSTLTLTKEQIAKLRHRAQTNPRFLTLEIMKGGLDLFYELFPDRWEREELLIRHLRESLPPLPTVAEMFKQARDAQAEVQ